MEPFLGEIRIFAGNYAPKHWAICNGAILPISQNTALFSLLGTTYGGDGFTTFALPDLRGRAPIHFGQGPGLSDYYQGQTGGAPAVTLTERQIARHEHTVMCNPAPGESDNPEGAIWAAGPRGRPSTYAKSGTPPIAVPMSANATKGVGENQPHNNLPPYLALTLIIALKGIFPPRS